MISRSICFSDLFCLHILHPSILLRRRTSAPLSSPGENPIIIHVHLAIFPSVFATTSHAVILCDPDQPLALFLPLLPRSSSLRDLFSSASNTKLSTSKANSGNSKHIDRKLPSVSCRNTWLRCPQKLATGLRIVRSVRAVFEYT